MKKCIGCGYGCEDNDNVCPMCGITFGNDAGLDNADHKIEIQFDGNIKQQSPDNLDSTVESGINTQKSTVSHPIPRNEGNKLFNSLWVLISFIPFISGFGIIYAGKKTSNNRWIAEGVLCEMPVIFGLLSNSSALTFGLVFLSIIVSFVRSLMIITRYRTFLNVGNYKKLNHRILALLMLVSSFIPFLNGIGFIYFGNKYSRLYLIVGVIFEMIWAMLILSFTFIPISFYSIGMIFGVAMASLLISGMCMISFNFDCDALYHYANNSPIAVSGNNKRYIEEKHEYYKIQLDDLKDVFDSKEKKVRDLINKRFGSGNITSSRFLAVVDNSHENVYKQLNSGYDLINYTSEPSQQVEEELLERITYINSINEEMEKLAVELVLNMPDDVKSDDSINGLLKDMENLISDIDKYE